MCNQETETGSYRQSRFTVGIPLIQDEIPVKTDVFAHDFTRIPPENGVRTLFVQKLNGKLNGFPRPVLSGFPRFPHFFNENTELCGIVYVSCK